MADDIYVAAESAMLQHDGGPVVVHKGTTTVRRGHPLLDEYPDLFEPLSVTFDTDTGAGGKSEAASGEADDGGDGDDELPAGVTHVGAGWYEVAGEKVRGRDAAVERAEAAAEADDEGDEGNGEDGDPEE